MKKLQLVLLLVLFFILGIFIWLLMLYRTYGMQTLLFLVQSPPKFLYTYSKNMVSVPSATPESLMIPRPVASGETPVEMEPESITIPDKHMITVMSHTYQKLNNCGPSSAVMAASTLGVTFDQLSAADVLKGSYTDKNVSAEELVPFLHSKGLEAIHRVNGNASQVEQLVSQDIPVIVEQWLVKRGTGEHVGHYRVVRGYDQGKQIFTTNDSFNGPNFVIPYSQFDEWWRPFNRGYIVVYKKEQEQLVKAILGSDWNEASNHQQAVQDSQAEVRSIGDGYSQFNLGTNTTLIRNYSLAVSAYDQALTQTFPGHFLWYQFGALEAYAEDGQYEKVLRMTDELLAGAGEMEEARYYRGVVFARQGKTAEARAEFEKALQANPRYEKATRALESL